MTLADAVPSATSAEDGRRDPRPYVVIGGGPRRAHRRLPARQGGHRVIVLEAEDQVGGLAKTVVDPDGYRFDLGGHRFFTKNQEVDDLWHEIMGDEFLKRPRMSRIFWRGQATSTTRSRARTSSASSGRSRSCAAGSPTSGRR